MARSDADGLVNDLMRGSSPMNAAQMQAMQEGIQKHVKGIVDAMGLRKYAVQAALDAKVAPLQVVETAEKIYSFLTAPAAEIVVRIE